MIPAGDALCRFFQHDGYYGIIRRITATLSASDVGALLAAVSVNLSPNLTELLHPLRDIDPSMGIFAPCVRDECQIILLGPDTTRLVERITDPEAYYANRAFNDLLEVWVLAILADCGDHAQKAHYLESCGLHDVNLEDWLDTKIELWNTIDDKIIRQCGNEMLLHGADLVNENTVRGEKLCVKLFDLNDGGWFPDASSHSVWVAGMEFNIHGEFVSEFFGGSRDLTYIFATEPFHVRKSDRGYSTNNLLHEDCLVISSTSVNQRNIIASIPLMIDRKSLH